MPLNNVFYVSFYNTDFMEKVNTPPFSLTCPLQTNSLSMILTNKKMSNKGVLGLYPCGAHSSFPAKDETVLGAFSSSGMT
ncbi:MAG: hypothetical protein A3H76_06230 [Candidatus Lloydbacteria bacterium RIFCSPLOWO2_02_FULL_54_12]|nr:MAG: hypothetical protein A3H76_06230 [Candidatus Lloydbacteria bacterium RIFCSPLOWO2_02_FULL_54_12]